jgi:hypothetical protein
MTVFNPEAILRVLARHCVDYIIVGGIGGVLHGSPMSTSDVDIVPALKKTNLEALAAALNELNASIMADGVAGGIKVQWTSNELQKWIVDFQFLNLETDHGRLDLIHRPGGTRGYQDLATKAEALSLDDIEVRVAALEDIIRSKQAVGRDRDLEHLPTLRLLLENKSAAVRPGQSVTVPWELSTASGTVVQTRGVGPRARAVVRVKVPGGGSADLEFPVDSVTPTDD